MNERERQTERERERLSWNLHFYKLEYDEKCWFPFLFYDITKIECRTFGFHDVHTDDEAMGLQRKIIFFNQNHKVCVQQSD